MNYPSIRIEGAILSPDILEGIEEERGQRPIDFNLDSSAKVKDEIARAWADAQDYWRIFQRKLETLKADSPATSETRQLWMAPLLGLLGYQLEYQPKGAELNGKIYNISHRAANRAQAPMQIVGYREPAGLDRKPERSNLRMSAHAVVQEFLNLNEQLYGLVTNGRVLRLLRDSSRLIKLSYLEFDLDRIFTDALFADFAILYRLLHATRLPATIDTTAESLIEGYHQKTIEQGTRIREGLREAVTDALEILGTGFLAHPENRSLREKIEGGKLDHNTFFSHLLRLIYRILFLNVVEERGLIFPKGTPSTKLKAYFDCYSLQRLRRLAGTRGLKTERHHDAWLSLLSTFQIFESPDKAFRLGTTAFGGQLFDSASLGPLGNSRLSNAALLEALDRLCSFDDPKTKQRHPVNFGALATEEFGSVYESLLELHPVVEIKPSPRFGFKQVSGNERKTSGSYYTPASLVDCLLDSALDPILDERIRNHKALGLPSAEEAIMSIKVCDPACGSGHFLIAAAQRIARRLALERAGDDEPSPEITRHALRQVISHCMYAVDINPMSVELCRVALWLEAVEPGKPLSFLDHHIRVGNSLFGTTPELIAAGLPDNAFKPIEGDDKEVCAALRKRNKQEREGQRDMLHLMVAEPESEYNSLAERNRFIDEAPDDTIDEVQQKAKKFRKLIVSPEYRHAQQVADAWCSAFVWKKKKNGPAEPLTTDTIRRIETDPKTLDPGQLAEVERLASQYQFFHWHLAFPEVFEKGGFDCVLGNPPWERIQPEVLLFFAESHPELLALKRSERNRAIAELAETDPTTFQTWLQRREGDLNISKFLKSSGRFPLSTVKNVNSYAVFQELAMGIIHGRGRSGLVLQSGIATDDINKDLFRKIMSAGQLISLFDFENRRGLFGDVHRMMRCCILTCHGKTLPAKKAPRFLFNALCVDELLIQDRVFELSADELALLSPNTGLCPTFRSRTDANLVIHLYRRAGSFVRESEENGNPWLVSIRRVFSMAYDSETFSPSSDFSPASNSTRVYEAKLFHQFDHRYASYDVVGNGTPECRELGQIKANPGLLVQPRLFADKAELLRRIPNNDWLLGYLLAYRDVTNSGNERTCLACILPKEATDDTIRVLFPNGGGRDHAALVANLNSFVLDYAARNCVASTHLSEYIAKQLPIFPPKLYADPCPWDESTQLLRDWLFIRVLELTYTAWDLEPFAQDCGWPGPPFRWNENRRFLIRCELDAAFFHLYLTSNPDGSWKRALASDGSAYNESEEDLSRLKVNFTTPRDAVAYIMDTFPIVRRRDEEKAGEYRTKRVILEIYDAMADSIRTGQPYQTLLDPPPADPRCCHPARDGTLAPGSCRQLSDLMNDHLPQGPFPLQPPSELKDALGTQSCHCRVLQPTDPLPEQDSWVIIRHPALQKSGAPCRIGLGRFRYHQQINAQTGQAFVHVTLRGEQPPAELNIPEAEWKDFRPLAILQTE